MESHEVPPLRQQGPARKRGLLGLLQRLRGDEEGQAAFEFLLMLPLFFVFFLLLVDMGLMTYSYVSVSNAAREGARYGAVNCGGAGCTVEDIRNRTLERAGGWVGNAADIAVGWDGTSRGDAVIVRIDTDYDFLFFPGVSVAVRSCSDMRLEQADPLASPGAPQSC
jgi:hypothetical protein